MSKQTPAQVAGRKICVPRRRCGKDRAAGQGGNSTPTTSFSFTPIAKPSHSDQEGAGLPVLQPQQSEGAPSFNSPADGTVCGPPAMTGAVGPATVTSQNESKTCPAENGSDDSTTAFSRMSLQERPARTLFEAVRQDDVTLLKSLLEDKVAIADQLNYALTMAVTKKSSAMAELLLQAGADPKYLDQCYPLLMTAADLNDTSTVSLLLKYGADANAGGVHGTPLHAAMRFGSIELFRTLVEAGAKIEIGTQAQGPSLMVLAMQANNVACVELLLEKGFEMGMVDRNGRTPLHVAAQLGKTEIVTYLLGRGADRLAVDNDGCMPWVLAMKNKHKKDADLLFPDKENINKKVGAKGTTALHLVCREGLLRCVDRLLQEGADVNAQDVDGMTPLMEAICSERYDIVAPLVKAPDLAIDLTDNLGYTALHKALKQGYYSHEPTLDILLAAGAEVNKKFPQGHTLLMDFAFIGGKVRWLLEASADPSAVTDTGETALGNAIHWSNLEGVKMLLRTNVSMKTLEMVGPRGKTPFQEAVTGSEREVLWLVVNAGFSVPAISKWLRSEEAASLRSNAKLGPRVAWLETRGTQPSTLRELARLSVLDQIGHSDVHCKVAGLPLPAKLAEFLHLDNFLTWKTKHHSETDLAFKDRSHEEEDDYEDDSEDSNGYDDEDGYDDDDNEDDDDLEEEEEEGSD